MSNIIHGRSPLALALAQFIGLSTARLIGFTVSVRIDDVARVTAEYLAAAPTDGEPEKTEIVRFKLVPIPEGES